MKFSYNWLRELSGTTKSPKELAELIMFHAFEVESVEKFPHGLDGVVVGLVGTVEPHPDADRLKVTTVTTETGGAPRTIVCGAPNVAAGQKVAVALPGASLPNGLTIKEAKIRGVASSGMICAEDELGLGSDHDGILVLPDDVPIGIQFSGYVGLEDTILDVNILPNRGCDALSYVGLAREIAALEGRAFDDPVASPLPAQERPKGGVTVEIVSDRCRRYVGILFEDVREAVSPLWMRAALLRSGLRPVGLAVDITNYLMLLHGQPMHAFDADVIGKDVVIRQAEEGETLSLLDGAEISLSSEDLVIADRKRPIALAGVMGGDRSGISSGTTRVFLEIATFDTSSVRKSAKRHRILTEASYRFERNVDTGRADVAATDAVRLFTELCGARVVSSSDSVTHADVPASIRFSPSVFRDMFDADIDLSDAREKLGYLGVSVSEDGSEWLATVPAYRPDLSDQWDLAEEVGRMIGYDAFPARSPLLPLVSPHVNASVSAARDLRRFLADSGWDEIMTYSFYSEEDAHRLGSEAYSRHMRLSNPMNPDQAFLRGSLLPTHLRKVAENRRFLDRFRFFELGDRYLIGRDGGPSEERMLSLVAVSAKDEKGFDVLKGAVTKLFAAFGLENVDWEPLGQGEGAEPFFHPTRAARLSVGGAFLGIAGEIAPHIAEAYGIRGVVYAAEIPFDALRRSTGEVVTYSPLPRFPFATRDLTLSVSRAVRGGDLSSAIAEASILVRDVRFVDTYEKADGTRNLTFRIAFGHDDRTVTGEEAEMAVADIVARVGERFDATLAG
ncbi:MAG: phenylalanine--tRNA ligase subunit beta [Candidatus Moranbacteria bacterium]|nr:phenylalanine--tRNA ligase subunit beta [Candidatus Moranbacteria bacterium]